MDLQAVPLTNDWFTVSRTIIEHLGAHSLRLDVRTRFDGYGNSVVRFVIVMDGKEIEFEKYNVATVRYNIEQKRLFK